MSVAISLSLTNCVRPGTWSHSASDPTLRKKYVKLVEDVRKKGAEVLIFSSMHESGQRELHDAHLFHFRLTLTAAFFPFCRTSSVNAPLVLSCFRRRITRIG